MGKVRGGRDRTKQTPRQAGDSVLTEKQAEVLAFIDGYICEHQRPPSLRQVAEAFGWSSPTQATLTHIAPLRKKGFLDMEPFQAKTLRVLKHRDGNRVLIKGQWFEWMPEPEVVSDGHAHS